MPINRETERSNDMKRNSEMKVTFEGTRHELRELAALLRGVSFTLDATVDGALGTRKRRLEVPIFHAEAMIVGLTHHTVAEPKTY